MRRHALVALVLLVVATGCSRPTTHHPPGTSHDTATGPVAPATQPPDNAGSDLPDVTLRIAITAGKVSPPAGRVEVAAGDRVAVVVTSDVADELRAPGLVRPTRLAAHRATQVSFVVAGPGSFTVATAHAGQVLTELVVR
ncbi:hypothetical protein [Nocardioides speluncae]|uniref:hypothetical protein n=1 Tax=Nocardioides speluncae TaxID=2670337 RepID=UPI0012B18607|nr:hypothetical protein [Nocardioides speluncae]